MKQLSNQGIAADAIHADKNQGARQRALAAFDRGRIKVLVATDIVARGIDVEGNFPRYQLRPAQRQGELCAPDRPHGPGRGGRHRPVVLRGGGSGDLAEH